jgi:hypothetical protein
MDLSWRLGRLALVACLAAVVVGGSVVAQETSPPWAAGTEADLVRIATGDNAAVGSGAASMITDTAIEVDGGRDI